MSQIAFRPLTLNLFLPSKLHFELLFELKNLEEMQLIASDRCKQSQSYHLRIIPSNSDSYNTSTFREKLLQECVKNHPRSLTQNNSFLVQY